MNEDEIRALVARLDTKNNADREAAWQELRPLGESMLPYFAKFFCMAKRLEARRDMAFHSIRFARISEFAFQIGLLAIADRSSIVRYRGCCVLAYSLRQDALAHLKPLINHSDLKTADDVRAAIDAIENHNHHYFVDRQHTGHSLWDVNPGDLS